MKLLMIIGQYQPITGGAEKECKKLSRRLQQEGVTVAVLTQSCEGLPEYEVIDGIPVYRKMEGGHLYEYTYMLSVLWFLIKHIGEYDIIQCFGLYLYIPPVALMKYLFKKSAVARIEGLGSSGDFRRIEKLKCGNLILKSARLFDRIIALSRAVRREITEHGFADHAVVTVPNSVDCTFFRPGEGVTERQAGKICFVGRLAEEKGVCYLLQAMKEIKKEREGIKLFIVGDGPLRSDLEELSRQLGLVDDTTFVGHADAVQTYYQEADLFVLPSLSEGLPLSLLEALSCGLPVIATAVGGSSEIVDPHDEAGTIPPSRYHIGAYGLLVNPEDAPGLARAVLRLLNDRALSGQLKKGARNCVAERYALEKVVGRYRALYSTLAGGE